MLAVLCAVKQSGFGVLVRSEVQRSSAVKWRVALEMSCCHLKARSATVLGSVMLLSGFLSVPICEEFCS
ncbi:hypothetical protein AAC387_Pa04g1766 [Persea americana]